MLAEELEEDSEEFEEEEEAEEEDEDEEELEEFLVGVMKLGLELGACEEEVGMLALLLKLLMVL